MLYQKRQVQGRRLEFVGSCWIRMSIEATHQGTYQSISMWFLYGDIPVRIFLFSGFRSNLIMRVTHFPGGEHLWCIGVGKHVEHQRSSVFVFFYFTFFFFLLFGENEFVLQKSTWHTVFNSLVLRALLIRVCDIEDGMDFFHVLETTKSIGNWIKHRPDGTTRSRSLALQTMCLESPNRNRVKPAAYICSYMAYSTFSVNEQNRKPDYVSVIILNMSWTAVRCPHVNKAREPINDRPLWEKEHQTYYQRFYALALLLEAHICGKESNTELLSALFQGSHSKQLRRVKWYLILGMVSGRWVSRCFPLRPVLLVFDFY